MNCRISFLFIWLISVSLHAQSSDSVVRGKVVDDNREALAFVTILAKDDKGNVLEFLYTDEEGEYQINLKEEFRELEFSYVGFRSQIVALGGNIPEVIILAEDNAMLEEVLITAKRPTIKREIDRLVFTVQDTPLASTNAWDIVKQTPGVTSIGDDLSVRGSQNILITINDKKVMVTGAQLKALLESTEGTQVESVEVITHPPAKYEAQGNAVLNIKLKKNRDMGYKGSIAERFVQTTYAYNTLSTQHTYTGEKANLSGNYSFGSGETVRYNEDNVIYANEERWNSVMTRKNKLKGVHSFQTEMDVMLDSTLTLTVGGNGFINAQTKGDYVIPTYIYNSEDTVESSYMTFIKKRANMDTYTGYMVWDKQFGIDKKLLWSSYFTYANEKDNQDVLTKLRFKDQQPSENTFATRDNQRTRLAVSGLDYSIDKETTKWETGAKYSIVKALYALSFWDGSRGALLYQKDKSNIFDYQEINWAGYASFTGQWGRWQAKVGVRGEHTGIQTKNTNEESHKQSYFKWFPTAYVKYDLSDEQQLGFAYSKRIGRPSYSWMNPAKSYYNLFSYFQGDPELKAAVSHNLNLSYNFSGLNIELFYNREENPSMEISYQESDTNMLIYHYTNIDKRQLTGVVASYSKQLTPMWSLNSFMYLQKQEDYFYGVDQKPYKNGAFVFGGRFNTSVTFDKTRNWKAMLTYSFYTPTVQGSFRISGYQRTDFIMSRDFGNDRWSASVYVYNIFGSDRQIIKTDYADQYNYFKDYNDTQGFAIGLRYNFGNQKVKYSSKEVDMQEKDRL